MKKLFTLTFILISFFAQADYWTQKANFPGASRWGAAGFSIGNKGFLGVGAEGISITYIDFWEYNSITNTWTQKANFGGIGRFAAVSLSINNKGYIGCGQGSSGNFLKDFWEYDAAANTWTQKADFGGTGRYATVGFSINNKGYIGTGWNGSFFKDFWEYDPQINAWTQKNDFGGTGRLAATGFSDGTKGYLGTGADTVTYPSGTTDFWEWDPNTNVWTQKANFGGGAREEACAFWICPYGYIGLGTTQIGIGTVSDFWKYNISNNTWTQAASFGAGSREVGAVFTIANKAYAGTGWVNDASTKADFWEYTPDSVCATGIEETLASNLDFTISPNPAKEFLIISYTLAGKENIAITITNAEGKKVYETKLQTITSNIKHQTSNYSKGIYFVELTNGKQKAVKKFVKE